jgi:hypothetical protein
MKKKSDVSKMVDAQAKGKKVRAKTDKKTSGGYDLDVRKSKVSVFKGIGG